MHGWRSELPQLAVIGAMFAVAAAAYPGAPDRIVVGWSFDGQPVRYAEKLPALFGVPALALAGFILMLFVFPRIDPGRANYSHFWSSYGLMRNCFVAVLAVFDAVIVLGAEGRPVDGAAVAPFALGGVLIVIGNVLGKIRPNWFVGVRTPWTLTSKTAWVKTHRLARWLFIGVGLAWLVAGLVHSTLVFAAVLALALGVAGVLIAYSYIVWERDPAKIPPAGTLPADE